MYDVPFTTYKCNTVEDVCIASLHFLITHGYCVKKCENCGNYFVPKRSDAKYCDRASGYGSTCKAVGKNKAYKFNTDNDELKSMLTAVKMARYMKAFRNKEDKYIQKEYNALKKECSKKEKALKSGAITRSDFLAWLEENKRFDW